MPFTPINLKADICISVKKPQQIGGHDFNVAKSLLWID
jgi:hypothetical protein